MSDTIIHIDEIDLKSMENKAETELEQMKLDSNEIEKSVEEEKQDNNVFTGFFDEETINSLDLLKKKVQYNDMSKLVNSMETRKNSLVKHDENDDIDEDAYLDEAIKDYSIEDLEKMSYDDILKLYKKDDDNSIELNRVFEDERKDLQFKKDYIIFRKQTNDTIASIEHDLNELDKYMTNSQQELNTLLDEYGDINSYILALLDKKIEQFKDNPEKLELYTNIKNSYNDSFTLTPLIKYVMTYKGRNILFDFLNDNRKSYRVYNNYKKVNKMLNIKTDITSIRNFEKYIYPEQEINQRRLNLFAFSLIHYIANKKSEADAFFGVFITQVITNMKDVIYNNFSSEEDKEKFISNVKEVLTIVGFDK